MSPHFLPPMDKQNVRISKISQLTETALEQWPDYFVVEVKIAGSGEIKVFIDADQGASIDRLAVINKALYKRIIEVEVFPDGNFSLEVSSPGLDEPLKLNRQYQKNKGRKVEVLLDRGIKNEGVLKAVTGEYIIIEKIISKNKKQGKLAPAKQTDSEEGDREMKIPFKQIKSTKVSVGF